VCIWFTALNFSTMAFIFLRLQLFMSCFRVLGISRISVELRLLSSNFCSQPLSIQNSSKEGQKAKDDAKYYPRFVDKFPLAKSSLPEEFCFFVSRRGRYGFLSNWLIEDHNGHIGENGHRFLTAEHELMFLKAKVFQDLRVMKMILKTENPAHVKQLGREVSHFREEVWREKRYKCVLQAVYNKFSQSPDLTKLLLSTGERFLVESAGYDPIFSIGLWEYRQSTSEGCKVDDTTFDVHPNNWMGSNLLGEALMETRQRLRAEVLDPEKFTQKDFEGFYGYYFIRNTRREKDIK
jgi:ribA/ribD-fused uncharacterized protein